MLQLLTDRRVALVDDVVSSGASIAAALQLMAILEIEPVVLGAAMLQSGRWRERLGPKWRERTIAVLESPILSKTCRRSLDRRDGTARGRELTRHNSAPRALPSRT